LKWAFRIAAALVVVLAILFLVFRTPDTDPVAMRAKYGGPPSQFVEIGDGVKVHLRDEGPRDGLPIVLLHGSNADLHTWEPWTTGLTDRYRVIRFDQVGHGLTGPDPQGDYSRANYASDIAEVMDALAIQTAVIGGNSMGGKHALAFATAYPERVIGLVLVDASGSPMPEEEAGEEDDGAGNIGFAIAQMPGINRIAEQITPRSLIEQSLEQSVSVKSVVTSEAVDRYWELLRYPGNRAATMARFSSPYDPLMREQFARIDVPSLILWGEEDALIPVSAGRWLNRELPRSQLMIYPATGHLPHEEAPAATLDDLRDWLEASFGAQGEPPVSERGV